MILFREKDNVLGSPPPPPLLCLFVWSVAPLPPHPTFKLNLFRISISVMCFCCWVDDVLFGWGLMSLTYFIWGGWSWSPAQCYPKLVVTNFLPF